MSTSALHRPVTHTELVVNSLARWTSREAFRDDGRSYSYAQKNNLQWYDLSDHLVFFDTSLGKLAKKYSEATGTYNVRLMGTYRNRLFLNLPGDGVLVVDASNPSAPVGKQFVRTLGWASHIEFAGDTAFVASGNFGIYELQLDSPLVIANN